MRHLLHCIFLDRPEFIFSHNDYPWNWFSVTWTFLDSNWKLIQKVPSRSLPNHISHHLSTTIRFLEISTFFNSIKPIDISIIIKFCCSIQKWKNQLLHQLVYYSVFYIFASTVCLLELKDLTWETTYCSFYIQLYCYDFFCSIWIFISFYVRSITG